MARKGQVNGVILPDVILDNTELTIAERVVLSGIYMEPVETEPCDLEDTELARKLRMNLGYVKRTIRFLEREEYIVVEYDRNERRFIYIME